MLEWPGEVVSLLVYVFNLGELMEFKRVRSLSPLLGKIDLKSPGVYGETTGEQLGDWFRVTGTSVLAMGGFCWSFFVDTGYL